MKRVSFEVAKAIKEAGYPQSSKPIKSYNIKGELEPEGSNYKRGKRWDAPTYLDVWLWLWREKRLMIPVDGVYFSQEAQASIIESGGINCLYVSECVDPEEAIEKAIEYLVDNNLIK